jgi:hypothetical protein
MNVTSRKLISSLFPALALTSLVFFFLPLRVYQGNPDEFDIPFLASLRILAVPALILLIVLVALAMALPGKGHRGVVALYLALASLVWIQGYFLVWKYGLLDGQGIRWDRYPWQGWVDGFVWLALLVLAVIFSRPVYKIAVGGSIALMAVLLLSSFLTDVRQIKPSQVKEKDRMLSIPRPSLFEFSPERNVIQFVLDGFQSDFFKELAASDKERFDRTFDGFTFFEDAIGVFPTTEMSVPAYLGGAIYKNNVPTKKFLADVFGGKTIGNVLFKDGYQVDYIGGPAQTYFRKARSTNNYFIPVPYRGTKAQRERAGAAGLLDLALFRAAPHYLKSVIYHRQRWLFQRLVSRNDERRGLRYFSHEAFMDDLVHKMRAAADKPVYKYIHLMTPHPPILVNENCVFQPDIPDTREARKTQARCSLEPFVSFINRLKDLGIYDSSFIILQADHGAAQAVDMQNAQDQETPMMSSGNSSLSSMAGMALSLLAVKPPGSRGPMLTSPAQVSLADIPATCSSLLGLKTAFDGKSIFEIDPREARKRIFFYYVWQHINWQKDFFDHLDEFEVEGSADNPASWRHIRTYHSPKSSYRADRIVFGTADSSPYRQFGWGPDLTAANNEYTYNWALGNSASVFLSLPKNAALRLTARMKSLEFDGPQVITVKVDGKEAGRWELAPPWNLESRSLVLAPDPGRPDVSVIEFLFSRCLSEKGAAASLAVQFESLTLRPASR